MFSSQLFLRRGVASWRHLALTPTSFILHATSHILRNRWLCREPPRQLPPLDAFCLLRGWSHISISVWCLLPALFGDISLGPKSPKTVPLLFSRSGRVRDMRYVKADCATLFFRGLGMANLIFNFGPKHLRLSFHAVWQSNAKDPIYHTP